MVSSTKGNPPKMNASISDRSNAKVCDMTIHNMYIKGHKHLYIIDQPYSTGLVQSVFFPIPRKKKNDVHTEAPVRGKTGSSEGASARFAGSSTVTEHRKVMDDFLVSFPSENHGKMMLLDFAPPFLLGLEFILIPIVTREIS